MMANNVNSALQVRTLVKNGHLMMLNDGLEGNIISSDG